MLYGTAQFVINGANFQGGLKRTPAALEKVGSKSAREMKRIMDCRKVFVDTASVTSLISVQIDVLKLGLGLVRALIWSYGLR